MRFRWIALYLTMAAAIILFYGGYASSGIISNVWVCDGATGGAVGSLDSINSGASNLQNGDFAMVVDSGTSEVTFYVYDSGVSTAENTATHPYKVMPDNQPDNGTWYELSGVSAWGPQ